MNLCSVPHLHGHHQWRKDEGTDLGCRAKGLHDDHEGMLPVSASDVLLTIRVDLLDDHTILNALRPILLVS